MVAFRALRTPRSRPVNTVLDFRLDQLPPGQTQVVLALFFFVGLVYCFLGYAILRFLLALTGFIIAGLTATALGGWLSHGNLLVMAACLLLGGACGAMALAFLYHAGVFLLGFIGALLFGFALLFEKDAAYGPIMVLIFAFFGGFLALFVEKPVMKLATAAIGGWLTTAASLLFLASAGFVDKGLQQRITPNAAWVMIIAWVFMTLFGAAFQFSRGDNVVAPKKKKK